MWKDHLKELVCPLCREPLSFGEGSETGERIETGSLSCSRCQKSYPIQGGIPRFVPEENYANGFGFEWKTHPRTQYDSETGLPISETRFYRQTGWPKTLSGQAILEVGCGSGRFTEIAAATEAFVASLDYSVAVEANYASNGLKRNVLIVQGDLFQMPFRQERFDKLYCFGVLQHTPAPEKGFKGLPFYLKPGGQIALDVYKRYPFFRQCFIMKYWVRFWTKHLSPETLYRQVKCHTAFWWPILPLLRKIPWLGARLAQLLMICDYRGVYPLSEKHLREWAVLDTFDMLSPAFDAPQFPETVRAWCEQAGLLNVEINADGFSVEARGVHPPCSTRGDT